MFGTMILIIQMLFCWTVYIVSMKWKNRKKEYKNEVELILVTSECWKNQTRYNWKDLIL